MRSPDKKKFISSSLSCALFIAHLQALSNSCCSAFSKLFSPIQISSNKISKSFAKGLFASNGPPTAADEIIIGGLSKRQDCLSTSIISLLWYLLKSLLLTQQKLDRKSTRLNSS